MSARKRPWTGEGLVVRLRRKQSLCGHPGSDLSSGMEPEFLEDRGNVVCGGALGDREHLGDLAVGQPSGDGEMRRMKSLYLKQ